MRQQSIEQFRLDVAHRAREIAGHMDDGLERWKRSDPSLGCADVAGQRRGALPGGLFQ
jgi:hypothetical protein